MRPLARSSTRRAPLEARARRVVGGFAVDEETLSLWGFVGFDGTGGVALFTDDEEEADFDAGFAKMLGGGDLGGNDALGVAGAAAIEELRRLRRRQCRAGRCPCGWRGRRRG